MKKKRKKPMKIKKRSVDLSNAQKEGMFWDKIDERIYKSFVNFIQPIESKIDHMIATIDNAKSNVIVTNTILEQKKIITRDEFFAAFEEYMEQERGGVDETGQMLGHPVFSLYNVEG